MASLFTVGVPGKNLGIGCQLEDAGLLLGTRITDTNKEFSDMYVSLGKTNPEASWTILTASLVSCRSYLEARSVCWLSLCPKQL